MIKGSKVYNAIMNEQILRHLFIYFFMKNRYKL